MDICNLPNEILLEIFLFLPFDTITIAEKVCKQWMDIINTGVIWKNTPAVYSEGKSNYKKFSDDVKRHCLNIRYMKFKYVGSYQMIHSLLPFCTELIELVITMCHVTEEYSKDLKMCPKLRNLEIQNSYARRLSNDNLFDIHFEFMPELQKLTLSDFGLRDSNIEGLINIKNLVHLSIPKIRSISQNKLIELLTNNKYSLETVSIHGGATFNDNIVECVSNIMNLSSLTIIRCESLTDVSLGYLRNVQNWEKLSLWNNDNFTECALVNLFAQEHLHKIQKISFSKIKNISIQTVKVIAENCPCLTFFGLYRCPLLKPEMKNEVIELLKNVEIFFM